MSPARPAPAPAGTRGPAASRPPRRGARVAITLLFVSFLDVFALLPTVAPRAVELGAGAAALGLVVGAYSAANLPANLLGGVLVDRFGRRVVLVAGLLAAAAAVAAYALAGSVPQLVAIRLVHGAAGGILVPAVFAVVADHATAGTAAGRTMGRAGAVIGAAAVVGPAAAGVVRQFGGTPAVFVGVGVILAAGAVLALIAIPPDRTGSRPAPAPSEVPPTRANREVTREISREATREVRRALGGLVATTAAVGVLAGYLPGLVEERGAPPATTGLLFTVYALVAAGLMLSPLAGRVDQDGPRATVAAGLVALAASLGLLAVVAANPPDGPVGLPVVLAAVGVFGLGYGLVFPAVSGAVALAAPPDRRGRAFGWFNVAFSLGLAVGPPVAGWLSELVPALDPFATVGLTCLVAAGLVATERGRPRGRDRGGDERATSRVRRSRPEGRPPGSRRRASRGR